MPADAETDSPAPPVSYRRSIVALLVSVFAAAAGALAMATALGKLVYDLTDRELDLGWLGLAEFAPAAVLVLVTGSVADRFDRRRVGATAALGEALVSFALAWYAGTRPTSALPIFGLVVLFGVARAFAAPATRSLPADIVPADRLPWLVARFSGSWQAALIVGPVLGGFLYAADVRYPFVATGLLMLASSAALLVVRKPAPTATPRTTDIAEVSPTATAIVEAAGDSALGLAAPAPPARSGLRDALEGLRFIRHRPILLGAISLDLFAVLFGGAVALLPALAKDRLGVDAVGLGWLRAAGGIGAGFVTLLLAIRPVRRRVGRTLLAAVAVFGVTTIVLGVTRSFAVAFVAMAVLSGADSISVFVRATLVPLVTPSDKRGRVLAVENVFIGASNELGAFESGVAGQVLGPAGAIVLGGVGTLAVAGGWWFLFPSLRDVDRFPEHSADIDP
jgi:MFS family permease